MDATRKRTRELAEARQQLADSKRRTYVAVTALAKHGLCRGFIGCRLCHLKSLKHVPVALIDIIAEYAHEHKETTVRTFYSKYHLRRPCWCTGGVQILYDAKIYKTLDWTARNNQVYEFVNERDLTDAIKISKREHAELHAAIEELVEMHPSPEEIGELGRYLGDGTIDFNEFGDIELVHGRVDW